MHAFDVVGYTYQADEYHGWCVLDMLTGKHTAQVDNLDPSLVEFGTTESVLDALAGELGIDRTDEHSYDSDDFPKVIFASQVESDDEICGSCGEPLIG